MIQSTYSWYKVYPWYKVMYMIHPHWALSLLLHFFFFYSSSFFLHPRFSVEFCLITLFVDNIFCVFFMFIFIYFHLLFSFLTSQFSLWTESTGSSYLSRKPNRFNRILLLQVVSSPFNIIAHLFTSIICLSTNPKTFYSRLKKSNCCYALKYIHIKDELKLWPKLLLKDYQPKL